MYDDRLRLIEKRVVDFLLVLIERFSLGVTAEALQAIMCWKLASSLQRRPVNPKFQVEGVLPKNRSFSQKNRLNDISYGIKILTDFSSVLSQFMHLTDRRTDRILIATPRLHPMQLGENTENFKHTTAYFREIVFFVYFCQTSITVH